MKSQMGFESWIRRLEEIHKKNCKEMRQIFCGLFESELPADKKFFQSRAWQKLRYEAILKNGRRCQACGRSDLEIHVDHIKPRSKYPRLALKLSNLQILCRDCNLGKGTWDETDWRASCK